MAAAAHRPIRRQSRRPVRPVDRLNSHFVPSSKKLRFRSYPAKKSSDIEFSSAAMAVATASSRGGLHAVYHRHIRVHEDEVVVEVADCLYRLHAVVRHVDPMALKS